MSTQNDWFSQGFRKLLCNYDSPKWAYEKSGIRFSPKLFVKEVAEAGAESVQFIAKFHDGYCYYRSRLGGFYPIDALGGVVEEAHLRGIKVIAYFSVGYDTYAALVHPEFRCQDWHGTPLFRGPYNFVCLEGPYFDFALDQISEIASQYEIDGLWLDILINLPRPDLGLYGCYCQYSRAEWQRRHGYELPVQLSAREKVELVKEGFERAERFLLAAKGILRERRAGAIISFNTAGGPLASNLIRGHDFSSCESHPPHYDMQSLIARFMRGQGLPFQLHVMNNTDAWYSMSKLPASLMKMIAAIGLAQEGSACIGQNFNPDGTWHSGEFAIPRDVFSWIRTREAYCSKARGVYDIGIYSRSVSVFQDTYIEGKMDVVGGVCPSALVGVNEALVQGHFQFGYFDHPDRFSSYALVIIPDQMSLSAEELRAMRAYVGKGGRVITAYRTGLHGADMQLLDDFAHADVLGVEFAGFPDPGYCYASIEDISLKHDLPDIPLLIKSGFVRLLPRSAGALGWVVEPIARHTPENLLGWNARLTPGERTSIPLVTENRYGNGWAYHVCVPTRHPESKSC